MKSTGEGVSNNIRIAFIAYAFSQMLAMLTFLVMEKRHSRRNYMIAIETRGLSKTFDNGVEAVKGVDLKVERGEICGFLGPNGSGKTTTIRLLNGTLTPTRGESFVLGNASQDEIIRLKTATVAELAQMYEGMSVYQNLLFFAAMYDLEGEEAEKRIEEQLTRMQLWEKKDLKLGSGRAAPDDTHRYTDYRSDSVQPALCSHSEHGHIPNQLHGDGKAGTAVQPGKDHQHALTKMHFTGCRNRLLKHERRV